MNKVLKALDRGEVTSFSRNSYEVVFSIFMIALAYFYRNSAQIEYPRILYFFLLLLVFNFGFNYLLRRRASVNLWLVDVILLANMWIITGVLYCSGKGESYFWVLYLLPVFAASLMASFKDAFGVVFLCVLAIGALSWPLGSGGMAEVLSFAVKAGVLAFSAGVVYRTAQSRKKAELVLAAKRGEGERLAGEITLKEREIVKTASASEVGTLVSGVMHDLGNALSVILLSAQVASEDEKPEKADLDRIIQAATLARTMIDSALDLSRAREYDFKEAPLKDAAAGAVALVEYSARKKSVSLETDIPEGLRLRMSRIHIERLLINVLSNSISFVPEGGRVLLSAAAEGAAVRVLVTDNGPGFPRELLDGGIKAFATTRGEAGGTGLGLYVCDQIAQRHGGELRLSNAEGGGAKIEVFLPQGG